MWNIVGASVVGTSHSATGAPCQDFCAHRHVLIDGKSVVILALADGAGSAAHSDEGAAAAVEATLDALAILVADGEELGESAAFYVLDLAQARVRALADERSLSPRQFACTLLFAVISNDANMFVQVGDGAWAVKSHGRYHPATWPNRGEFANETYFITSPNWRTGFQFYSHPLSVDAVAGFTDGIQAVALRYADNAVHEPFIDPLVKVVAASGDSPSLQRPLVAFLSTESLNERTDDDKTLLIAARRKVHLLEWPTLTKAEMP